MSNTATVLAFDFGASSGRAIRAVYDGQNLNYEEIHSISYCLTNGVLFIVVGRGKVRLEHDIVEQLLAGCEQNIDLRTPGIMLGL